MFAEANLEYSLNLPSRCISSLPSSSETHRYVVGTCFTEGTYENQYNEIHVLKFDEELNEIITEVIYSHKLGEIWCLNPCPKASDLVVTTGGVYGETWLWRFDDMDGVLNEEYNDSGNSNIDNKDMMQVCQLESRGGRNVAMEWKPGDDGGMELAALSRSHICHWDLHQEVLMGSTSLSGEASALRWDPHSPSNIACSSSRNIAIFDTRSLQNGPINTLKGIHRRSITSLDYNPNRPHILVSSSEDSTIKFHDMRNPSIPLKICRGGHSHWVTNVKYNPFHDQLLLSTGTDSLVNLWRISSISSAPLLELQNPLDNDDDDENNGNNEDSKPDVRVNKFEGQDSIYDVAWSCADAWSYCSVGFDGNVVLHHVPSQEKYKILL